MGGDEVNLEQMGDNPPISPEEVQRAPGIGERLREWLNGAEAHMRIWIHQDPRYTARYGITVLKLLREFPLEDVLNLDPDQIRADVVE